MRRPWETLILALAMAGSSCTKDTRRDAPATPAASRSGSVASPEDSEPAPSTGLAPTFSAASSPFVDTLPVPGDQDVFVVRGGASRPRVAGILLHGYCTHGMGFLQAFQFAAARVGPFLALQGDLGCGRGSFRAWSHDLAAIDRRIDAAVVAYVGTGGPREIVLVGSSQGVDRAIGLAKRFPEKYTKLVLMSAPQVTPAAGLDRLEGAYFFVGANENQQPTKATVEKWRRAGRHVALRVIEGAGHSDFGGRGDPLMLEAFRFLDVPQ